jgi:HPt (histidine-containing phosphotransfer) domain-containing protein
MSMHDSPDRMDFDRLQEISGGDPDFEREVLEAFVAETSDQLAIAQARLELGDADAASHEAHAMRGVALNVGARAFAQLIAEIEALSRDGELAAARAALSRAHLEFDELRSTLRQYLRGRAA